MSEPAPGLSTEQLRELLRLLKEVDSVELKLSIPDANQRSTVSGLGMDPLDAEIRQVVFFDTPDLALDRSGVVVRARRVQRKSGDTVVKLRPLDPEDVPKSVRMSPAFGIEVDAMPGGFVCSGSMKGEIDDASVKAAIGGDASPRDLFTKEQRSLYSSRAPDGIGLDDLTPLGPLTILKLKFTPRALSRKMVAELWFYPDGSRILELSTKCDPSEAFEAAAEARVFLGDHGIELAGAQHTKTRAALDFFAAELTRNQ